MFGLSNTDADGAVEPADGISFTCTKLGSTVCVSESPVQAATPPGVVHTFQVLPQMEIVELYTNGIHACMISGHKSADAHLDAKLGRIVEITEAKTVTLLLQ